MNSLGRYIALLAVLGAPVSAAAGSNWCEGVTNNTYLSHNGVLYINGSWRNQHTAICSIKGDRLGVTPEVCKGWLSAAIAAKLSQNTVVVHYEDVPSCAEVPQYGAAPRPTYLMLR